MNEWKMYPLKPYPPAPEPETVYVVEELDQEVEGREVWVNVDEWDGLEEAEEDAMAESRENETGRTRVVRVTREVVKAYRKGAEE